MIREYFEKTKYSSFIVSLFLLVGVSLFTLIYFFAMYSLNTYGIEIDALVTESGTTNETGRRDYYYIKYAFSYLGEEYTHRGILRNNVRVNLDYTAWVQVVENDCIPVKFWESNPWFNNCFLYTDEIIDYFVTYGILFVFLLVWYVRLRNNKK